VTNKKDVVDPTELFERMQQQMQQRSEELLTEIRELAQNQKRAIEQQRGEPPLPIPASIWVGDELKEVAVPEQPEPQRERVTITIIDEKSDDEVEADEWLIMAIRGKYIRSIEAWLALEEKRTGGAQADHIVTWQPNRRKFDKDIVEQAVTKIVVLDGVPTADAIEEKDRQTRYLPAVSDESGF